MANILSNIFSQQKRQKTEKRNLKNSLPEFNVSAQILSACTEYFSTESNQAYRQHVKYTSKIWAGGGVDNVHLIFY